MFTICTQASQAGIHDSHLSVDPAPNKDTTPIAELQVEHHNGTPNRGPDDDNLFVSPDSTPAENVRWMMLFQAF